ncbi:MAG: YgjV family protein [Lachnospiraceae bacterium]|nr:YgjV family protein [Lachnospiraceae bacterium]
MNAAMMIEIYGYIGSVLVVVSMLMSSIIKLRVINILGSVISGSYALIIGSFPLVLMNSCLIIINVYNLYKLLKAEQKYDLVDSEVNDAFIGYFVSHYKEDIQKYFPNFAFENSDINKAYIVFCEGNPSNILLGKDNGNGVLDVILDYSTPVYRDCSAGKYLYAALPSKGVKVLQFAQNSSKEHEDYLTKMGFKKENGVFQKNL